MAARRYLCHVCVYSMFIINIALLVLINTDINMYCKRLRYRRMYMCITYNLVCNIIAVLWACNMYSSYDDDVVLCVCSAVLCASLRRA